MIKISSGNRSIFGIESGVFEFIENPNQLGIGYFIIQMDGKEFGVKKERATILGNSYWEIKARLARKGRHTISFGEVASAAAISCSIANIIYNRHFKSEILNAEEIDELVRKLYENDLVWAPDGDSAFDDGSHIIQIDCENYVRLICFNNDETEDATLNSIVDLKISSLEYYGILADWRAQFSQNWTSHFGSGKML